MLVSKGYSSSMLVSRLDSYQQSPRLDSYLKNSRLDFFYQEDSAFLESSTSLSILPGTNLLNSPRTAGAYPEDATGEDAVSLSGLNATSADNIPMLPAYIAYTSLVVCCVLLSVGVIGNLLVLVVILTSKSMRSSTNLFLLNLSIADLLVLVVCCPTVMVELYLRKDVWLLGRVMCILVPFVELTVSHSSVLIILAITIERYYAICLPLQAGAIWTKGKALLLCLISWLLSVILSSPVLSMVHYDPLTQPYCTTQVDTLAAKGYFLGIISLFFWLPLLVLVVLYSSIARHLTARGLPNKHAGSGTGAKACCPSQAPRQGAARAGEGASLSRGRRQVVVMLGTVVAAFFACLMPFKVLTMWVVVSPEEVLTYINPEIYFNLLYFARLMFYLNSAINPILYNTMSSRFRERFRRVFGCGATGSRRLLRRSGGVRSVSGTTSSRQTSSSATRTSERNLEKKENSQLEGTVGVRKYNSQLSSEQSRVRFFGKQEASFSPPPPASSENRQRREHAEEEPGTAATRYWRATSSDQDGQLSGATSKMVSEDDIQVYGGGGGECAEASPPVPARFYACTRISKGFNIMSLIENTKEVLV